ncbi:hypothetical protein SAMN02745910_01931 [Priestia endophytica DSM 13796]|uniref:Uncharacterized protein n=1 Tax=Priestia endophytica DSM 13796 TaxID=1121089 RepID=A0A1I5ZDB2_9BACI|nr:hypothetical protein SAMN02745910_01931 [Priestia endophytica DSM 13796]
MIIGEALFTLIIFFMLNLLCDTFLMKKESSLKRLGIVSCMQTMIAIILFSIF